MAQQVLCSHARRAGPHGLQREGPEGLLGWVLLWAANGAASCTLWWTQCRAAWPQTGASHVGLLKAPHPVFHPPTLHSLHTHILRRLAPYPASKARKLLGDLDATVAFLADGK